MPWRTIRGEALAPVYEYAALIDGAIDALRPNRGHGKNGAEHIRSSAPFLKGGAHRESDDLQMTV